MSLRLGDLAPNFQAQTTEGNIDFHDWAGNSWVVLYSHPADFTPVCTTEFVAFAKRYDQFQALNAELLGLSIDQIFSHIKWDEWIEEKLNVKIPFPIIADSTGNVAMAMGMIHPGKASDTVRAVFLIDPNSVIRIILFYPQEIGRNMDEILRALKALQTSDANKVAIPAGWPNNELIGDRVIIPPAKDVETARKRKTEYDNYDWWFCHKSL